MLTISVIIPVYNAAGFVPEAVQSALIQPQVSEVLLVEDGSPDDALSVCRALAAADPRVKLLQHADGENRGPGASRNLGIAYATSEFVSFLDADDYMRPNRFAKTQLIFKQHPDADGVYEAMGYHFENEELEHRHQERKGGELTTVKYPIAQEDLFWEQAPVGRSGYAPTGGWTVKRLVFERCGLFDESLPLHQDTDLFMRFAIAGRMYPGEIEHPVAMRRVHSKNRVSRPRPPSERFRHRIRMWCSTWRWARANGYQPEAKVLLRRLVSHCDRLNADGRIEKGRIWAQTMRYVRAVQLCSELRVTPQYYWFITQGVTTKILRRMRNALGG